MYDDKETVAVDVRALHVEGHSGLARVPRDHLLYVEESTLGMKAGYLSTGWTYGKGAYPGTLRDLQPVDPDEAKALIATGTPVHEARRAADWNSEFPALVQGLSVRELRAALADADLPDDALVAIRAAEFPERGVGSPASPHVEVGYYRPDPASGTSGSAFGGEIDYDADGGIPAHLRALVLKPTH